MTIYRQQLRSVFCLAAALLFVFPLCGFGAVSAVPQQPRAQPDVVGSAAAGESLTPLNAVESAAQNGDLETLRRILKDGPPSEQASAFDLLYALDATLAIESVVADFHNQALGTRLLSLQLIDRSLVIDNETALNVLREALHDRDTVLSDCALDALARRVTPDNRLLLTSDLSGPETQARQLAEVSLAAADQDRASLLDLIRKGDGVVQSLAFETLAAKDPSSAIAELVSAFGDKASMTRVQSLELLIRTPYAERKLLLRVLQQAAADEDPNVKNLASRTLDEENRERAQEPGAPNIM
jgi:hypothetical protein